MNISEAHQLALGYAWGTEDHTETRTVSPDDMNGPAAFAAAFAHGWDEYNTERRGNMVPVKDAYEHWQNSEGKTIFCVGDSTAEQQARHAQLRKEWRERIW